MNSTTRIEQAELALDEAALDAACTDLADRAIAPAHGPWREQIPRLNAVLSPVHPQPVPLLP